MDKKQRQKWYGRILGTLLVLVGYYLIVTPYAIDWYSRIGQTATISGYHDSISSLSDEQIAETKHKMFEYNNMITNQHAQEFYRYSSDKDFDEVYLSLPVADNSQICTIEIPKINVNVPVGHGTDDDMLQTEIGHLYGTSLPIGGDSTHSVMAGHSALRTAELFTRLDELEKGDIIYINVLNERHAYKVSDINIVLPEECDQYMQVEPGKDLITLYTCTPYGVNTHRLLVTAERTDDPVRAESNEQVEIVIDRTKPIVIFVSISILPIIIAVGVNVYTYEKDKKASKSKNSNLKKGE